MNMGYSLWGVLVLIGDIWAIINILQSSADNGTKLIWVLVVLLLPVLGLAHPPAKVVPLCLGRIRRRHDRRGHAGRGVEVWCSFDASVDRQSPRQADADHRPSGPIAGILLLRPVDHAAGDFDVVGALKQWKTTGKAPDQIIVAESGNGRPDRKRLVCAYPRIGQYKGSGDTADPGNFVCKNP
jgi:hypothetical protein